MKTVAIAIVLVSLQLGQAAEVTPVQKVIQLMSGMLEKGKLMKHDEQLHFAAYKQFCDDTSVEKTNAIAESEETMQVLKADIGKYTAAAARLTKEIAELDEDVAIWKGDIKAATAVRDIEKHDAHATLTDYSESIDALEHAIRVLKGEAHDRKQAESPEAAQKAAEGKDETFLQSEDSQKQAESDEAEVEATQKQAENAGADIEASENQGKQAESAAAEVAASQKQTDAAEKEVDGFEAERSESFMQLSALTQMKLIPDQTKHFVDAFLQSADTFTGAEPEANAYEFQSSGVVEMLTKLMDKFIAERTALEQEEANSRHAYEMLMQDLQTQLEQGEKSREEKSQKKAKALEAKAETISNLQDTAKTWRADKKYLKDLTATCAQKASDFDSRQQLRSEEIEAIEKAIEIISGDGVAGSADKHLPTLLQVHSSSSLGQLRASSQMRMRTRLIEYLQGKSKQMNSRVLSALATHVADDPFTKVKKLIKDLIIRLMQEANEEAEHKGWCDEELSANEHTRKEKTEAVEILTADIDELEASSAKLAEELTELSKAVSELDEAVAKATNIRQEEKAKNFATIKDAMDAQVAVAQAVTVLKEFYAKSGEATAFVQQGAKAKQAPPEIFDSEYKGMLPEKGGVVGMLEVIESDFARLESDTKAAEASAQKEYNSFVSDSKEDKAQKEAMIEHKTAKAQDQAQTLQQKRGDMEGTQKELDAALSYFEKLKPSCVDAGNSYEDRVSRRKEELESLQEAMKILNGEDIA